MADVDVIKYFQHGRSIRHLRNRSAFLQCFTVPVRIGVYLFVMSCVSLCSNVCDDMISSASSNCATIATVKSSQHSA